MPTERRSVGEIREEIATERAQLEEALAELRKGIDAKRKPATVLVGALSAVLAAVVVRKFAQRLRNG